MDSDDDEHSERVLKVVVCGDGASGKTSLCMRFSQDNFGRHYQQTVGLDFFSRRLLLPGNVSVLLQVTSTLIFEASITLDL
uniref:Ras-related protein Rab-28 n=1 Tax=Ascaris lumbricoides TaxID=6252 RepID=A0A0M3IU83_ASCLU